MGGIDIQKIGLQIQKVYLKANPLHITVKNSSRQGMIKILQQVDRDYPLNYKEHISGHDSTTFYIVCNGNTFANAYYSIGMLIAKSKISFSV